MQEGGMVGQCAHTWVISLSAVTVADMLKTMM